MNEIGATELAVELQVVVRQLVNRYRRDRTLPAPQLSALALIEREAHISISRLASLESVRPQSMAQTIRQLEVRGLVQRSSDKHDGRKTLISLTTAGQEALAAFRLVGESWVAELLASRFDAGEIREFARGVELMRKLLAEANRQQETPG